jgi:hypothetical protein
MNSGSGLPRPSRDDGANAGTSGCPEGLWRLSFDRSRESRAQGPGSRPNLTTWPAALLLYSVYRVRRCAISLARPLGAFAVPTLAQFVDGGSVVLAAWLEASRFGQPRGGAERERSDSAKVGPHGAYGPRMTIKLLAAEGYTTNCNPSDCGQSHVRMKRSRFQLGDSSGKPLDKKNPFMSMWLRGANSVIGRARVQATAQAGAALTKQMSEFWSGTRLTRAKRRR